MKTYILSIDQGTTGSTAALIDSETFELSTKVNHEFKQHFPKPSWVEHDLEEIWDSVVLSIKQVMVKANITSKNIKCIGITNQRETICAFDYNGIPLEKAIVWQDRRTQDFCQDLQANKEIERIIKNKTGLPIDPYFCATKITWLLNSSKNVMEHAQKKDLKFGTIDTFLLYRLTNGKAYKTDATNASRTLLMDLKTCDWDDELLNLFELEKDFLPSIERSTARFGQTLGLDFLDDNIPITGVLGDQQAALFGHGGIERNDIKCTYGTGAFVLQNTGKSIVSSNNGLLTTVAYKDNEGIYYALEGSCYIAGAAIQWLRDNLDFFKNSIESEVIAQSVSHDQCENILFLPFFTGIASPHWLSHAKAAIVGLTRDSHKGHITRACLEGIGFSIDDLLTAFTKDTGLRLKSLNVDGGMVANNFFLQLQSNISDVIITRPRVIETTAYGAALAAAIGHNLIKKSDLKKLWKKDRSFNIQTGEKSYYNKKHELWNDYISRLYL